MKTIQQALKDAIHYDISVGFIENALIYRSLDGEEECTSEVMHSESYRGAFADCLWSLVQAVNFSEADKSVGSLSDKQLIAILNEANSIYQSIGEPVKELEAKPTVYIGG
ncbi:hypothetical protein [Paraprevotella xylaniphila]|uniref:hypothetical protein n=1 Tax=Paraprevotella xylaniphila TaxID=454155 RepID=UPI001032D70C|nr:hypothetical protein [Paraprevotella xylaniphila]